MEERMIDDEYGRGIKLKKTADGYIDATDELAEETEKQTDAPEASAAEELMFEFPELDEDDEDLVGLSPEEALALRRKKEEEAAKRKAEYEQTCKEGEVLLESGSFKAAELKFEKALELDDEEKEASIGYWRAKTADFTEPDVLVDEYADAGFESLEFDLGYRAVDEIKARYKEVFERRVKELEAEEEPLAAEIENKRTSRRAIIKERIKKAFIWFGVALLPALVTLILGIVFGTKILSTPDGRYVAPTIVFAALFVVFFIGFGIATNKLLNAFRIYRANENVSSTDEGKKLLRLRDCKEIYERFLD
ncbi:MAG: hypothetical protein IJ506_06700 [Clostridia bacterium]|nr:hypothetical protein [Clostridia bacterium]